MNFYLSSFLLIFLNVGIFKSANGLQWKNITPGTPIPKNAILIDDTLNFYVGRAKGSSYYLPAQIDSYGTAAISPHTDDIEKKMHSQILTTSEWDKCEWKPYYYRNFYEDIDKNAVRVGMDDDGNTIFIGRTYVRDNTKDISSIYLPYRKETQRWKYVESYDHQYEEWEYLSCDPGMIWVNSSAQSMPNGVVKAGTTEQGYDMYVARMMELDDKVQIGYAVPELGATVFDNSNKIATTDRYDESYNAEDGVLQILVGERNEYEWIRTKGKVIPDFGVVTKFEHFELYFIVRIHNSIRAITQEEAFKQKNEFDVLVKV